jgi:nucleoside-diphosphate-sugar epimerase
MTGTVLVTGGAGFIGAYVSRALLGRGVRVLVYDLQPRGNVLDMLMPEGGPGLLRAAGEITDGWRLLALCREHGVDAIVHLASPLTQDVAANPTTGLRDICGGTAGIFALAGEIGARRIVWASSVAVFGPQAAYPPGAVGDDACHRPPSLYGSCKSLCETLARTAAARDGVDSLGLRLSVVYGAGRLRGYMSYPSHMIREAAAGRAVHVAYSRQRLHWQYVEEVAEMMVAALAADRPGGGRTYNGLGDSRSFAEAGAIIARERPDVAVTFGEDADPALAGTVEDYDAAGFAAAYGYRAGWPLERGIADALATYGRMGAG